MNYFISIFLDLLVINQLPTFDPLTIGTLATLDPGLFITTSAPSILTRPPPTTTLSTTTLSSTVTSTEPVSEDNTVLYITVSVVFGLFAAFEMWYFMCRKGKKNETPQNVDRFYESIDYSSVYELPKQEEYTNENPPPIPEKPQYGVRVNTSV